MLITALALFAVLSGAQAGWASVSTPVFPLAEVRLNMPCTIRTEVAESRIADLPCRVSFVDRIMDTGYQIQVRLVNPELVLGDLKGTNAVMGGMSGSPLYINGRLAGAVARTQEGLLDSIAWCTPIEEILAAPVPPPAAPITASPLREGEHFYFCLVWGDVNLCSSGTATTTDPRTGYTYLLGHEDDEWGDGGALKTGRGTVELPFWRSVVEGFSRNSGLGGVESYPVGEVAGTLVWHGQTGYVADLSRKPRPVAVSLAVGDRTYRFTVAYGLNANHWVQWAIQHLYQKTLDETRECQTLTMRVTVEGLPEPMRVRETEFFDVEEPDGANAHIGWTRLMSWLFRYAQPRMRVTAVDASLEYPTHCTLLLPGEMKLSESELGRVLHISGVRERDMRPVRFTAPVPAPSGTAHVTDGVNLQKLLFKQGSLADILPLLNAIEDRSGLYLYEFTEQEFTPHDDPTLPSTVLIARPQVRILGTVNLLGMAGRMAEDRAVSFEVKPDASEESEEDDEDLLAPKPKE